MLQDPLPKRVRVLVLGGGIHGVGVLHDLVSRGWKDVHLIEKDRLASGTSSRSTKLIHGGLRYLEKITQFGMVSESLHERNFLIQMVPDLVKPLEFIFPIHKKDHWRSLVTRLGLTLYDVLSGKENIHHHKSLSREQVREKIPSINLDKFSKFYSFWDGQVDDLALVWRIAQCASSLGAGITEGCRVVSLRPDEEGWQAIVRTANDQTHSVSALYVINCLGPWSNIFLEQSGIKPSVHGFNNRGSHLIIEDRGLKSGLFLQSPIDGRVLFMLPWMGKTLLGTTEDMYQGSPDHVRPSEKDVDYILASCNAYLETPILKHDILCSFAGLRWLAESPSQTLSSVSRESVLSEHHAERGMMITIYGGKLTSYRALAEKIGDRITKHFGEFRPSATKDKQVWKPIRSMDMIPTVLERFQRSR
jgi:glycerol-3-phosphate dehydrogenase